MPPVLSLDRALELHQAGRLPEALAAYRAVAQASPEDAGTALNNACVVEKDLGDYRAALADCREALRLRRAEGDVLSLGETLNNLGLVLEVLGQTAAAEKAFAEALAVNQRSGETEGQAINLGNLGALALATGRYAAALELYTRAADLAARNPGEPWAAGQAAVARLNQGVVLEKLGAFREALEIYRGIDPAALDPLARPALRVNAGVLYRNLGDPVRAAGAFREAIGEYRRAGDSAGLSNALLNLGLALHRDLARPAEAEAAFRQALALAETSGDRTEEVQDLFYLGRLLLDGGRLGEAEAVYRRCLKIAESARSAEGRWSAREGLGRIDAARSDLRGALRHFDAALTEIERVRAGIGTARRSGFFGDKRAVYAAAVDVLAALARREPEGGWAERAFGVVQQAKARDLLDALGGQAPAVPLTAAEVRRRLRSGRLLEYFAGERGLYRWTAERDRLTMTDLGPAEPVFAAASAVHRRLSHGSAPDRQALGRLSTALLGTLPDGPLRIAPDGALRYLPFEILERDGRPLVERHAVSYLPSASALPPVRSAGRSYALRLLGVGEPVLEATSLLLGRWDLPPLPAAGRELAAVARRLGGRHLLLTGRDATERSFRQSAGPGARVVHWATHAVLDREAAVLLTPEGADDGLLRPGEIAALDLPSDLTVLAACSTALGEEDGRSLSALTGAFLAAGSRGVIATLWDVGDQPSAVFMDQLYAELAAGRTPAEALRRVKLRLRQDPRWADPALWAGYVLVGEPPAVARPWWRAGLGWMGWLAGLAALAAALAIRKPAFRFRSGAGPSGRSR